MLLPQLIGLVLLWSSSVIKIISSLAQSLHRLALPELKIGLFFVLDRSCACSILDSQVIVRPSASERLEASGTPLSVRFYS